MYLNFVLENFLIKLSNTLSEKSKIKNVKDKDWVIFQTNKEELKDIMLESPKK